MIHREAATTCHEKVAKNVKSEQKIMQKYFFFHRFQLRGGNLRPPDPPYNVEGNERTESRGWGKVKAIVYNIIVAKRIVSTSHPTCKNFSKFSIVFNA